MALSRFNKFLVLKWYAEQTDIWSEQIRMKWFVDVKRINKEFRENDRNLKKYYALKNKWETNSFQFHSLKSRLVFC